MFYYKKSMDPVGLHVEVAAAARAKGHWNAAGTLKISPAAKEKNHCGL